MAYPIMTYEPDERPDVEVEVDGRWRKAEIIQWEHRKDGIWWARCVWKDGAVNGVDYFQASRVRPDMGEFLRGSEPPPS